MPDAMRDKTVLAHDASVAARLWRVSAELVGLPADGAAAEDGRLAESAS
jgi:hypothetical protein